MRKTDALRNPSKIGLVALFALWAAVLFVAGTVHGIEPIVNPSQVLYGSAQKTITQTSDVKIDTTTHVLTAAQGTITPSVTFNDGTVISSTNGIAGASVWGSITGTLGNQADLQTKFNAVGTSTASLQAGLNNVGVSTASLQTGLNNVGVSTASLQSQVLAIGVSTGSLLNTTALLTQSTTSLQSQIVTVNGQLSTVAVATTSLQSQMTGFTSSTNSLQSQINNVAASTGTLSTSTTSLQSQITALPATLPSLTAANTFTGQQFYNSPSASVYRYGLLVGSFTVLSSTPSQAASFDANNMLVGLSSLPVSMGGTGTTSANLTAGTNVTITGTWPNQTINAIGAGGASNLQVTSSGVQVTSPTASMNFGPAFTLAAVGSTATVAANVSSVTLQGNTFNLASKLVQLSAGSQLPGVDGNLLTNLNAVSIQGDLSIASGTISTFRASSETVSGQLTAGTLSFPTADKSNAIHFSNIGSSGFGDLSSSDLKELDLSNGGTGSISIFPDFGITGTDSATNFSYTVTPGTLTMSGTFGGELDITKDYIKMGTGSFGSVPDLTIHRGGASQLWIGTGDERSRNGTVAAGAIIAQGGFNNQNSSMTWNDVSYVNLITGVRNGGIWEVNSSSQIQQTPYTLPLSVGAGGVFSIDGSSNVVFGAAVSLSSTQTWTAQQSFTSPKPSTFTLLDATDAVIGNGSRVDKLSIYPQGGINGSGITIVGLSASVDPYVGLALTPTGVSGGIAMASASNGNVVVGASTGNVILMNMNSGGPKGDIIIAPGNRAVRDVIVSGADGSMTIASSMTVTGQSTVGSLKINSGGSSGKAICWKTATSIGFCSTIVDAGGACTCN